MWQLGYSIFVEHGLAVLDKARKVIPSKPFWLDFKVLMECIQSISNLCNLNEKGGELQFKNNFGTFEHFNWK